MLSKKVKYAINALIVMAKLPENQPSPTAEIARMGNIPKKFLELILLELKNFGIVSSIRGKDGGYYLRQSPDEINLATIVRLFDGPIALLPCVTHNYYQSCPECEDENTCALRSVIKDLRDITVKLFKETTLSELLKRENELKEKLNR